MEKNNSEPLFEQWATWDSALGLASSVGIALVSLLVNQKEKSYTTAA